MIPLLRKLPVERLESMKTIQEVGQIISELTDRLSIAIPTNAGDFNLQKLREIGELRSYWRGYLDCLREMQKEEN